MSAADNVGSKSSYVCTTQGTGGGVLDVQQMSSAGWALHSRAVWIVQKGHSMIHEKLNCMSSKAHKPEYTVVLGVV